jgi:MFS family permease
MLTYLVPASPPAHRPRAFGAIFASVAISTTGFLASNTVNGLVAEDLTGSTTWTGIPAAATVLGTALGASALSAVVARLGARSGLAIGYLIAALAIGTAGTSIILGSFPGFVAGLFMFGVGFGANRLARYVVADLYDADQRATMIGWIVWASTIGAVLGPSLLAPSRAVAESLRLHGLVGPFLVCATACLLSMAAILAAPRAMDHPAGPRHPGSVDRPLGVLLKSPGVSLALTSMISGQFVMVLLMTMTPLHLRHEGHALGAIGAVISGHTLGMFAFSPITGRIGDRHGRRVLLWSGVLVLVVACVIGAVANGSYWWLVASLFLLGVGWNLGFVGGSALLTDSTAPEDRARVQGAGDTMIWTGGALASLASGWLLSHMGYAALSAWGVALSLVPLWPLWRTRRAH